MAHFDNAFKAAKEHEHKMPPWANEHPQAPGNLPQITQRAIDIFMMSKKPGGEMGGIGWWQTGNAYTAIALHDHWAGSNHNYQTLADTVKQCERNHHGLINEFNDDTLWWAMACLHLYSVGGDPWFLEKARGIWQHIHNKGSVCGRGQIQFKDNDMEGGCYWTTKPGEGQINSISSGLYAELSVRLALVDGGNGGGGGNSMADKHPHLSKLQNILGSQNQPGASGDEYLEAARCSLGWILRCRYRPRDAVVLDGFRLKKGEAVDWAFSYLSGVPIGTCALLYEATRQDEYMTLACHIAHRAMRNGSWVDDNGVLTERGSYGHGHHDPAKNNDAVGFKAVLMRHLAILYEVIRKTHAGRENEFARQTAGLIKTFIEINFESQQTRNTNGNGQYGPWWNGPFECPTTHSQHAVLDVMAAIHLVERC